MAYTNEPREWAAESYDRLSDGMKERGVAAVERLRLDGDEVVLDAGCGTGRVTEAVLGMLPRGRVIALDGSQEMLDLAAERFAGDGRVSLVRADLERELPLEEKVDAVVSTSTFHWVRDHDALFSHLAGAMRPGAQLVVDCGGAGNVASVLAAFEEIGETYVPWNFATPEETAERLERAGFTDIEAWLSPHPVSHPPEDFEEFLATVVLGAHLDRMGEEAGREFVREVAGRVPGPTVDYVRLNIAARRV